MNQSTIYILLIAVGVGLCGLYGARFSQSQSAQVKHSLERQMLESLKTKAKDRPAQTQKIDALLATLKVAEKQVVALSPTGRLQHWNTEHGLYFYLGLILILTGSVLARKAKINALMTQGNTDIHSNVRVVDFADLLKSIAQQIQEIQDRIYQASVNQPTHIDPQWLLDIETLQKADINHLVNAREQFRLKYGMDAFTEVFGTFSQGERRLNRTWSALVDQHRGEALTSITASSESMQDAVKSLDKVLSQS